MTESDSIDGARNFAARVAKRARDDRPIIWRFDPVSFWLPSAVEASDSDLVVALALVRVHAPFLAEV